MVTKRQVLRFMRVQRVPVTVGGLAESLSITQRAAELRLLKLWRARLIEPASKGWRRQALREIGFQISVRGAARLDYWELAARQGSSDG